MNAESSTSEHAVAILGLGAMGSRMAKNVLRAGHEVIVYNRTSDRAEALEAEGAQVAATPREAAVRAEIVISMVTDDDASRTVWLGEEGAACGLRESTVAIESSTLTPRWTREVAKRVSEQNADFLDAPVVGSRPQAEAGALIYLVGGAAETVERVRPVLEIMGNAVHHVGPVGQGMTMKLVVNAFFGIQVAAMGELLGLIRRSGTDEQGAVRVLGAMPVTSPALKGAVNLMAARDFAPLFPIDLVEKDFRYVVETARSVDAAMPVSEAVRERYAQAIKAGYGGDNIAAIAKLVA